MPFLRWATFAEENYVVRMAILSGCDYLDSIHGMGLKTAHSLMRRYRSADKVGRTRHIMSAGFLRGRSHFVLFHRSSSTFVWKVENTLSR